MKNNPLSLWTLSYRKSYYITHPWKLFKDIYWNCRNFWHRGRYGYAYVDVWNLGDWAPRVIAEALRYLANHGQGYPGVSPWETPEKWREHLNYLANQMQRCADFMDSDFGLDERNEYKKAYEEMLDRTMTTSKESEWATIHFEMTEADKELSKNYYKRQAELIKVDKQYAHEVFGYFGENLSRWWD